MTNEQDKHWTDDHIKEVKGEFIAYDESGIVHSKHESKKEAKQSLIDYSNFLSKCTSCGE